MKTYQLLSLGIAAFSLASSAHYLFSKIDSSELKLLAYGAILIFAVMGVILDDSFTAYFGTDNKGIIAIFGTIATSIFLGGAYRAFTLNEKVEGYLLVSLIGCFWVILLAIYIKLIMTPKESN